MIRNILKRDLRRNKVITVALILFIAISSMLSGAAASLGYTLTTSIAEFFKAAKTAHMIQMHSGNLDGGLIEKFAKGHQYISSYQIVNLLNVNGASLILDQSGKTEMGSVIDNAFVMQNNDFDFILDQNNRIIELSKGEAAIPAYYALKYHLSPGDIIKVKTPNGIKEFKVVAIGRDSQMNASFISSKRILIREEDWNELASKIGSLEYIIEFRVTDETKVDRLEKDYKNANLPSNGPRIPYESIKLLNSLNDIIVVAIIIIGAIVMIFISVLCIRFTMIMCMDEDYMEIGVMKSIGIPSMYIENMYFIKYALISLIGCIIGYLASFGIEGTLQSNLKAYMGLVKKDYINHSLQLIASIISGMIVLLICSKVVKGINKISAVETLQGRKEDNTDKLVKKPSIYKQGKKSVNLTLGFKYMMSYKKPYILMTLIFILLTFLIILPLNLTTTMGSEDFISYMGIAKCDIRIDLQNADKLEEHIEAMEKVIKKDKDIDNYALYKTYAAVSKNKENEDVFLNFEIGNFSDFKINYYLGREPKNKHELGLSYLAAKQLDKGIGDEIIITINDLYHQFILSGIYQDITNGGKSAKSLWAPENISATLALFNINTKNQVNNSDKKASYSKLFKDGKVTDIEDYLMQTMGDIIRQLKIVTVIMILVGGFIIIFTTIIFIKLLIIRNRGDLTIMKRIGFNNNDIRIQYMVKVVTSLLAGILLGTVLVNVFGQLIVGLFTESMGAPQIRFTTNVFYAYILFPLLMFVIMFTTLILTMREIKILKND